MRKNWLPELACAALMLVHAPVSAGEALSVFAAEYKARVKVATGTLSMASEELSPGNYQFTYSIAAGGMWQYLVRGDLEETSRWQFSQARPRPDHYKLINTMGSKPRNGDYAFDWDQQRITGTYKTRTIDLPLPEGVVDRSLLQLVLMHDMAAGEVRDSYTVFDRDELEVLTIEHETGETISVPHGTYATEVIRHTRENGADVTRLWFAPELGYMLVRVEQIDDGDVLLTAELAALR